MMKFFCMLMLGLAFSSPAFGQGGWTQFDRVTNDTPQKVSPPVCIREIVIPIYVDSAQIEKDYNNGSPNAEWYYCDLMHHPKRYTDEKTNEVVGDYRKFVHPHGIRMMVSKNDANSRDSLEAFAEIAPFGIKLITQWGEVTVYGDDNAALKKRSYAKRR